jgi:hypothetical protein
MTKHFEADMVLLPTHTPGIASWKVRGKMPEDMQRKIVNMPPRTGMSAHILIIDDCGGEPATHIEEIYSAAINARLKEPRA